jgi:L-galactose dehydrogenase
VSGAHERLPGAGRLIPVALGDTGLMASSLAFGASAIGGEFGPADHGDALATVEVALHAGIRLFDTAPAYGATRSERRLGEALAGVPRSDYVLATKVGKTVGDDGRVAFDYTEEAIRRSLDASCARLRVDVVDVVHLHDFEYEDGRHVERALHDGFATLQALKAEGRVRAVGAGIYPLDLWKRVLCDVELDVALVHNHHTLCDTRALELLALAEQRGVTLINAAPFASGLLTGTDPPAWHPAPTWARAVFAQAAGVADRAGVPIARLAFTFARSEPRLPITLFSCARPDQLRRTLAWLEDPLDPVVVATVQRTLEPVMQQQWTHAAGRADQPGPEPTA